jgi:hypothetical protein
LQVGPITHHKEHHSTSLCTMRKTTDAHCTTVQPEALHDSTKAVD